MKRIIVTLAGLGMAALIMPAQAQSRMDKTFVSDAMADSMAEVQMGQMASQRGGSDAVKNYGQMLVTDHTKALDELKPVASNLGVQAPQTPKPDARATMAKLSKLDGAAFDKAFVAVAVKDHKKAINLYQKEAKGTGSTADLAKQQLPVLQNHYDQARSLEGQVKSSSR
jgi:putative membrane protein